MASNVRGALPKVTVKSCASGRDMNIGGLSEKEQYEEQYNRENTWPKAECCSFYGLEPLQRAGNILPYLHHICHLGAIGASPAIAQGRIVGDKQLSDVGALEEQAAG